MNNPLARPTEPPLDPDYATRDRKEARRFWGALALAIIAIIGTTYAVIGTREAKTEITQIQHSACAADPASLECQQIKAESDRKQPVVFACIPIRKIAKDKRLLALTKCQEAAQRAEQNSSSTGTVPNGGDAHTPSQGQEPGPPKGGHPGGSTEGHVPGSTEHPEHHEVSESPSEAPHQSPESPAPEASHIPESGTPAPEPATPAAPKSPVGEVLAPVTETVCHLNALGVRICIEVP